MRWDYCEVDWMPRQTAIHVYNGRADWLTQATARSFKRLAKFTMMIMTSSSTAMMFHLFITHLAIFSMSESGLTGSIEPSEAAPKLRA